MHAAMTGVYTEEKPVRSCIREGREGQETGLRGINSPPRGGPVEKVRKGYPHRLMPDAAFHGSIIEGSAFVLVA